MLYATIDYLNEKHFLKRISIEEILGEVNVLIPRLKRENNIFALKRILAKIKKYNVQNVVLNNELLKNKQVVSYLEENNKYIIDGTRLRKSITTTCSK